MKHETNLNREFGVASVQVLRMLQRTFEDWVRVCVCVRERESAYAGEKEKYLCR